jgi:hypothetical protein
MTHAEVQAWLDRYIEAWRSLDRDSIGELFSPNVAYRYQPYEDAVVGRDALVDDWLRDPDAPGSWSARYGPYAVDGDRAVAVGESRYLHEDGSLRTVFHNVFLLRFDAEGRCAEFTEYWRERPEAGDQGGSAS